MSNPPCVSRPRPGTTSRARVILRLGLLSLIASALGCQTLGSVDPDPIHVASSGERTDDAIRDALRRDGWEIETWSPGEVFAGKESDGESLRIRIHHGDGGLHVSWIDDGSLDGTVEENNERKREIRRALKNLADRIEYHIQSVDLEARRNDDARPSAALDRPPRSSTTR